MQHLEEGTIHAWLDGALSAADSAQVEAHVAECAECRSKVAEARGFIAASSRILTALDDVPAGVIPVARRAPRVSRAFLSAAAVALVVATGGLLVTRANRTEPPRVATVRADAETTGTTATLAPANNTVATAPTGAPPSAPIKSPATRSAVGAETRPQILNSPPLIASGGTAGERQTSSAVVAPTVAGAVTASPVPPPPPPQRVAKSNDTTVDIVLSRDAVQLQMQVVTGVATTASSPLRILKQERTATGTRTTYEVSPGKVAVLTGTPRAQRETGVVTPALVAERRASSTPPAVAMRADDQPVNSIQWTGRGGELMVLSGPFSIGELQEIRRRIEAQQGRGR